MKKYLCIVLDRAELLVCEARHIVCGLGLIDSSEIFSSSKRLENIERISERILYPLLNSFLASLLI